MQHAGYKKSSFGVAFFFLTKEQRQALAAYYAFCRLVDDIVDEPEHANPAQELNGWEEEILRLYNGRPQTPLGQDLWPAVQTFGIKQDRFLLLIKGMRADITPQEYPTFEALKEYMFCVAGVVGLAVTDILGVQNKTADDLARTLGNAVQLTNIIRDIWDDAARGRVYLPQEDLERFGLTRKDILTHQDPAKTAALLAFEAERAEKLYRAAWQIMQGPYWHTLLACRIMGYVYFANLAKIKKTGFIFQNPVKLTKWEKLRNVLHALYKKI